MLGALVWSFAVTMFLLSVINLFCINRELGGGLDTYLISVFSVGAFLAFWAWLTNYSAKSNFGVATTEKIFNKCGLGRYLVNMKHDMFCSKLVCLADKEIGGSLSSKLKLRPDDVQPVHIAEACDVMGWNTVNIKDKSRAQ